MAGKGASGGFSVLKYLARLGIFALVAKKQNSISKGCSNETVT